MLSFSYCLLFQVRKLRFIQDKLFIHVHIISLLGQNSTPYAFPNSCLSITFISVVSHFDLKQIDCQLVFQQKYRLIQNQQILGGGWGGVGGAGLQATCRSLQPGESPFIEKEVGRAVINRVHQRNGEFEVYWLFIGRALAMWKEEVFLPIGLCSLVGGEGAHFWPHDF